MAICNISLRSRFIWVLVHSQVRNPHKAFLCTPVIHDFNSHTFVYRNFSHTINLLLPDLLILLTPICLFSKILITILFLSIIFMCLYHFIFSDCSFYTIVRFQFIIYALIKNGKIFVITKEVFCVYVFLNQNCVHNYLSKHFSVNFRKIHYTKIFNNLIVQKFNLDLSTILHND